MIEPPVGDQVDRDKDSDTPLPALLRVASAARLYRSADGRLQALVPVGDRHEVFGLQSAGFRHWLVERYFADRLEPPTESAVRRVIGVLEGRARFDGGTPSAFVRVGHDSDASASVYYLDLGDPSGRAIRIGADGWLAVDRPDVQFWRPAGLLPLPMPSHDGSIELLRPYVNLNDADFRLMIVWLTAALRPVGPYPILVLYGEQGSAKSTLARLLRLLIDPQSCPLLAEPNSTRDLMVTALNGWLLAYDNISKIPTWLSDSLCRLAVGGGFAARALFSNDERSVIHAQRPVILNGIDEFVRRGDLIDRSVILRMAPIAPASRCAEADFWRAFQRDYPQILGGVLDAVAGGLRELPSVHLPELPRMADYAKWGEAVSRDLGWAAGTFQAAYAASRHEAIAPVLEDSAVGTALLEIAPRLGNWSGSITELQAYLTRHVDMKDARVLRYRLDPSPRWKRAATTPWPKTTQDFSKELRRVVPQLRLKGLSIDFKRTHQGRHISITQSSS